MRPTSSRHELLSYNLEAVAPQLFLDPARCVGDSPARHLRARHHQAHFHMSERKNPDDAFSSDVLRFGERLLGDIEGNDPGGRYDVTCLNGVVVWHRREEHVLDPVHRGQMPVVDYHEPVHFAD